MCHVLIETHIGCVDIDESRNRSYPSNHNIFTISYAAFLRKEYHTDQARSKFQDSVYNC